MLRRGRKVFVTVFIRVVKVIMVMLGMLEAAVTVTITRMMNAILICIAVTVIGSSSASGHARCGSTTRTSGQISLEGIGRVGQPSSTQIGRPVSIHSRTSGRRSRRVMIMIIIILRRRIFVVGNSASGPSFGDGFGRDRTTRSRRSGGGGSGRRRMTSSRRIAPTTAASSRSSGSSSSTTRSRRLAVIARRSGAGSCRPMTGSYGRTSIQGRIIVKGRRRRDAGASSSRRRILWPFVLNMLVAATISSSALIIIVVVASSSRRGRRVVVVLLGYGTGNGRLHDDLRSNIDARRRWCLVCAFV